MSTIKNILTFGAYGRIEEAMKKYNEVKKRYNSKLYKMKSKSREVDAVLEKVVRVKIEAIRNLKTFKEFSTGNIESSLNKSYKFESADFKQINQTLEKGQLALTAATGATVGATAGVGTALAAWGLASTLGVASTGTAISTLSGVAATNATLALLGGGAVAVGGGGMIAGATVLGGIVAIPALVGLGVFSHFSAKKKIEKIESAIYKMQMTMYKMNKNTIRFKEIQKKSNKLIRLIKKKSKHLKYELNIANRFANGEMNKITRFYHQIRMLLFNRNVTKLAKELSILIDTPIFTESTEKADFKKTFNKKNGIVYKMLAVVTLVIALYVFAVPSIKDIFSFNPISKSDLVITDKEKKGNLKSSDNYNEPEEEINHKLLEDDNEYNVVTIIVTENYGDTEIITIDFGFNPGETMNDVLQTNKEELELVVKDNRIFSIKGVERNLNGSERWLAQITDVDGIPVDSIESELNNGDVIELDLH